MKLNAARAALWMTAATLPLSVSILTSCAAIDRSAPSPIANGGGGAVTAGGARHSGGTGDGNGGRDADGTGGTDSAGDTGSAGDAGDASGNGQGGSALGGAGGGGRASGSSGSATASSGTGGDAGIAGSLAEGGAFDGSELVTDLTDGYYSLSAAVTKTGGGNCYISVKDYGDGPERMTSLPVATQATTIVVRGVHVVGGQATIGSYNDAQGTGCSVRNVQLIRDDIPYQFLNGGDASEVTRSEDSGVIYRESDGTPSDPFVILKNHGYNIARLRLYNDPGNPSFSPSSEMPPYSGRADILALAKRAKAQGLMIELTFHYSDYWTNAGTQCLPHDWASLTTFSEIEAAMKSFTQDFMAQMAAQGTTPEFVSIGNESNGGLLYPFGCAWALPASSHCPSAACSAPNWPQLGQLYGAAYDAVKAVSPSTQVIIHLAYDNGSSPAYAASDFNLYFNKVVQNGGNYDIKGLTYYPFWSRAKVSDLVNMVNLATAGSSKPVLIMESGYNWNPTREDGTLGQLVNNGPEPYPSTPQGQKDFMLELYAGIKQVNAGKCLGDLYWDPLNVIKNSQVSNTAMFDFDGKALPALDATEFNN